MVLNIFLKCYGFCFYVKTKQGDEMHIHVQFISASVKIFIFMWFLHHQKKYMYFDLFPPKLQPDHLVHCSVIPTPPQLSCPPVSFPAHLTPYQVGTQAFHSHKIFYICGSFHCLQLALWLNSYRKWKIIGNSKNKKPTEAFINTDNKYCNNSDMLMIIDITLALN